MGCRWYVQSSSPCPIAVSYSCHAWLKHAYPFRPCGEDGGRSNSETVLVDPGSYDPTAATARHKWRGGQWLPINRKPGFLIRQDSRAAARPAGARRAATSGGRPGPCYRPARSPWASDRVWMAPAGQGCSLMLASGRLRPCIRRRSCSLGAARPDGSPRSLWSQSLARAGLRSGPNRVSIAIMSAILPSSHDALAVLSGASAPRFVQAPHAT